MDDANAMLYTFIIPRMIVNTSDANILIPLSIDGCRKKVANFLLVIWYSSLLEQLLWVDTGSTSSVTCFS